MKESVCGCKPEECRHGTLPPLHIRLTPGERWVRCLDLATGPSQKPGWRWEVIDAPIADIVEALQGRIITTGCCSGHGQYAAHILLADGRVLVIHPTREAAGL